MSSLRHRLLGLWLLTAVVAVALAGLLLALYRQTSDVQLRQAQRVIAEACADVAAAVGEGMLPAAALDGLLRRYSGVEGGVWDASAGFIAYAYPTHVGGALKEDMPATEEPLIETLARSALTLGIAQTETRAGTREAFSIHACPAGERAAWTMMRVSLVAAELLSSIVLGIAGLLAFVVAVGLWLAFTLQSWSRKLGGVERALADYPLDGQRALLLTGSEELDRIVSAVNALNQRLADARTRSEQLARSLTQSERLAAIGRTAAGLAHEIRNPLATLRLRAENAMVDPDTRALPALEAVLTQVHRLEKLMQNLLTLTQPIRLEPRVVELHAWLHEHLDSVQAQAAAQSVTVTSEHNGAAQLRFDPQWLGRALDNLLRNAVQHSPSGTSVHVQVQAEAQGLRVSVADEGPGIPAELRATLFEPFARGRAEGTGLGLALVREVAQAHGGQARLLDSASGAHFEIEIPDRP